MPRFRAAALAAQAVDLRATRVAIRIRRAGEYVDGSWQGDRVISTPFRASIQPARPAELQRLPEGQRREETIRVLTRLELRVAEAPGLEADVVEYAGRRYTVVSVETRGPGLYFDALAISPSAGET